MPITLATNDGVTLVGASSIGVLPAGLAAKRHS